MGEILLDNDGDRAELVRLNRQLCELLSEKMPRNTAFMLVTFPVPMSYTRPKVALATTTDGATIERLCQAILQALRKRIIV